MRKIISLRKYARILETHAASLRTETVLVSAEFLVKMKLSVFKNVVGVEQGWYKIQMTAIFIDSNDGYSKRDVFWINPERNNVWHLKQSKGMDIVGHSHSKEVRNSRCWEGMLLEQITILKYPSLVRDYDYRESRFGRSDWLLDVYRYVGHGLNSHRVLPEVYGQIKAKVRSHQSVQAFLDDELGIG